MKKLLTTALLLGSVAALGACTSSASGTAEADLDGTMTQAPYAEERTTGATRSAPAPVVRSAQPVFERRQVK